ncbi:hypothetical protein ACBJ59_54295 [Nonomuraea sp. MTCD27]|uniref:hypothetical protein n=1 Tax=Nonomuraea sp. MTCD27 TaxID=1676747 RepID=UPI0035BF009D
MSKHTAVLADLRAKAQGANVLGGEIALTAGSPIAAFEATTTEGQSITLAELGDHALVGFFSPPCGLRKERLPDFLQYAAGRQEGSGSVLAVLAGTADETGELAEPLRQVASVVVEPDHGPLQHAFAVTGFPAAR